MKIVTKIRPGNEKLFENGEIQQEQYFHVFNVNLTEVLFFLIFIPHQKIYQQFQTDST